MSKYFFFFDGIDCVVVGPRTYVSRDTLESDRSRNGWTFKLFIGEGILFLVESTRKEFLWDIISARTNSGLCLVEELLLEPLHDGAEAGGRLFFSFIFVVSYLADDVRVFMLRLFLICVELIFDSYMQFDVRGAVEIVSLVIPELGNLRRVKFPLDDHLPEITPLGLAQETLRVVVSDPRSDLLRVRTLETNGTRPEGRLERLLGFSGDALNVFLEFWLEAVGSDPRGYSLVFKVYLSGRLWNGDLLPSIRDWVHIYELVLSDSRVCLPVLHWVETGLGRVKALQFDGPLFDF